MKKALLPIIFVLMPIAANADIGKGKTLFETRCAACHGSTGAGDGPVAAGLPPETKPRNLQNGELKVAADDAKFTELLQKGGGALGLSPLMPSQPDLGAADIASIIEYVKSLRIKK